MLVVSLVGSDVREIEYAATALALNLHNRQINAVALVSCGIKTVQGLDVLDTMQTTVNLARQLQTLASPIVGADAVICSTSYISLALPHEHAKPAIDELLRSLWLRSTNVCYWVGARDPALTRLAGRWGVVMHSLQTTDEGIEAAAQAIVRFIPETLTRA